MPDAIRPTAPDSEKQIKNISASPSETFGPQKMNAGLGGPHSAPSRFFITIKNLGRRCSSGEQKCFFILRSPRKKIWDDSSIVLKGRRQARFFDGNAVTQKAALAALPPSEKIGLRRANPTLTGVHISWGERSWKNNGGIVVH